MVAERLCHRVSNVQAEFDGSVAELHKTIDRIEAITTGVEELFTEMGRLMGQVFTLSLSTGKWAAIKSVYTWYSGCLL